MEEKIDVILATYNGERFLKEQLDSILNQTYKNINLIISDDCSKDGTRQILKEYEKKDSRIKLYFQEQNLGFIKNFEFLLKKVESKYYALSDQDDVWLEDKLEKSYKKLIDSNSDLVHCDLRVVDSSLNTIYKSRWKKMGLTKKVKYDDIRSLYLYNCVTGCTILSKKEFLKYILPLPYKSKYMVHDYWISIVIAQKGKIAHIDEPLILYRQHGDNEIGTKRTSTQMDKFEDVRKLFITVKKEHFEDFISRSEIFTDEQNELNKEAYAYFTKLKDIKGCYFRGLKTFNKLYKYDTFSYYMLQCIILNFPALAKIGFKVFKFFQKIFVKNKVKAT